jgi:hypothetical protein
MQEHLDPVTVGLAIAAAALGLCALGIALTLRFGGEPTERKRP